MVQPTPLPTQSGVPSISATSRSTGKVFVVLPAYNEEVGVARLLPKIQATFQACSRDYEVIVVNDASTDDTGLVASQASFQMPVNVVDHAENRGLAGAIKTGLETAMAAASHGDVIVSMDADDTHAPGLIPRMLQMIDEGHDVVIASRYQAGSRTIGVPWNRVMLTHVARWIFKLGMPIRGVRDYTCGFRAYRCEALEQAMSFHRDKFFTEQGFSCMVDIILKMRSFDFVFGEVPMILRYDNKPTDSKMNVSGTAAATLSLLFRRRLGLQ